MRYGNKSGIYDDQREKAAWHLPRLFLYVVVDSKEPHFCWIKKGTWEPNFSSLNPGIQIRPPKWLTTMEVSPSREIRQKNTKNGITYIFFKITKTWRKFDRLYLYAKYEVTSIKNTISLVSYIIEKLWSFRIQNYKLRPILIK